MLDSFYPMTMMTLKLLTESRSFGTKTSRFCHLFRNVVVDVITLRYQICKPLRG